MRRTRFDDAHCPIARTTDLLGDWWTPLVMRDAFSGSRRFDDFRKSLGLSRGVLTERLNRLVETGLLEKRLYEERPPRYEYVPTEKGRAFFPVLAAMWRWGSEWMWDEGDAPILEMYDRETREPVQPVVVDRNTGEAIDPEKVRIALRRKS